jgi:hypothetical protein
MYLVINKTPYHAGSIIEEWLGAHLDESLPDCNESIQASVASWMA